jgi:hypothetical protein
MKCLRQFAALVLGVVTANAQTTIFNQNFDGAYTGPYSTSFYAGGSPAATSATVVASGGNPNGCLQIVMTTTTSSDFFAGQAQLMTVAGNTDLLPADYVLSFDAKGSRAANIQVGIQTWPAPYFGGTGPVINATTDQALSAANTWQTFKINLGNVTTASPTGATWQLNFQFGAWQWGGAGITDSLIIDNIVLTHLSTNIVLSSSTNPATYGAGVGFTATVVTNGATVGNATGQVVFSYAGGPFSTNTITAGTATSSSVTNLPVGTDIITAAYVGNYGASSNTLNQSVNPPSTTGTAQSNLTLYADSLANGFQNWSWATVNLQTLNPPPHSGVYSIGVTDGGNYQALAFNHGAFNTSPYTSLTFWIKGETGGQNVQVWGLLDGANPLAYPLPTLSSGWQQITIPLASLGVANKANCTGFWIQGSTGAAQPTFYVDDIQLVAAPPPALVHLGVDAAAILGTADARHFGINTATWDGSLGNSQTLPLLQSIGCLTLRWPGGSTSDEYHWESDTAGNATFQTIATNLGAQVFTTVNYGSGTASEAAAWVRSANQTNHCSFKYWEIGNECYGSWETDTHAIPQDPYTYATNAVAYIQQMKAAYPATPIKVGVVVVPGESTYSNNATHFAVNPRTGATNYGWTPVVLSQMKALGVLPDFLIYHFYPQWTAPDWTYYAGSADSDPLLLQVAGNPSPLTWSDWASAAADLRQQITDYLGTSGSNIELCVTENNSDAGTMGRQSTSLVNALYLADSMGQLLKTEFRAYIWWDFRNNGPYPGGDFDPTIYGWRTVGDYGMLDGASAPYPTFYAARLMQYFARPSDGILSATTDHMLLSAYAARRTNGALSLLVINKNLTASTTGQIAMTNFTPTTTATVRSYGIRQDQAMQTNGSPALRDIATNFTTAASIFTNAFPPLSLTLFTFAPGPATLSVLHVQPTNVQLQLQGQAGAPYVIQSSTDLNSRTWTAVSTDRLVGNTLVVNIPTSASVPAQYYRAIWQP